MEKRTVNVERFDAAFRAMLGNAEFRMSDICNCLKGSYCKFVLQLDHTIISAAYKESPAEHFGISGLCYYEWYNPLDKENAKSWTDSIDLTDARACIENVMRIVERHHGSQPWLPLFPEREHATGETLDAFLDRIGVVRPRSTHPTE